MIVHLNTAPRAGSTYMIAVVRKANLDAVLAGVAELEYDELDVIADPGLCAAQVVAAAAPAIRAGYGEDAQVVGVVDQTAGDVIFEAFAKPLTLFAAGVAR